MSSKYLLLLLIHTISILYCAHPWIKISLGIYNFLEEVSGLSHSIVVLYFFALITEEGFLISPCSFWSSAFKWEYLSFSPLPFTSLLFTAICKASSGNHFAFLHFSFGGDGLDQCLLYSVMHLHPSFFRHSIRSNPLNPFATSTV